MVERHGALRHCIQKQKIIKLLDPNLLACTEHERLLEALANSRAWIDFTQGLDIRLLSKDNMRLLNQLKIKIIHFVWDLEKYSDTILKNLELVKNTTTLDIRKISVYLLVNYNTSFDFDLYRINTLRRFGYDPYVMVYNRFSADKKYLSLQRWVNFKQIWRTVETFEEYSRNHKEAITNSAQIQLF